MQGSTNCKEVLRDEEAKFEFKDCLKVKRIVEMWALPIANKKKKLQWCTREQ